MSCNGTRKSILYKQLILQIVLFIFLISSALYFIAHGLVYLNQIRVVYDQLIIQVYTIHVYEVKIFICKTYQGRASPSFGNKQYDSQSEQHKQRMPITLRSVKIHSQCRIAEDVQKLRKEKRSNRGWLVELCIPY